MSPETKRSHKQWLAKRHGWKCYYCAVILTMETATLDHVLARSLGGSNHRDNLLLSCLACNKAKGSQSGHLWLCAAMQGLKPGK